MIYENNLSILKLHHPELTERVDTLVGDNGIILTRARNGNHTCKVSTEDGRWVWLHSRYDPEREADSVIQQLDLSTNCIFVLLGLGLGYHLFALLNKTNREVPTLVFESRLDVFKRSLEIFDWTGVLERRNLRLFIGEEIYKIEEEMNEKIKVDYWNHLLRMDLRLLKHPPSVSLHPHYYQRIEAAVTELRTSFLIRRMEVIENVWFADRLLWNLKETILAREGINEDKDNSGYIKGLVSIIMPVHSRLEVLKEVLSSLYRHTIYPCELIIWDNNSDNETRAYLKKFSSNPLNPKIHTEVIFHPENIGKNCLNECIKRYARGEYILVMDSDIVVSSGWLEGMVRAVERVPRAGYLTANMNAGKVEDKYYRPVDYNGIIIEEGPTGGACTIIRRDVYRDIGEFLEMEGHTYICEDGNYSHRAREKGYVVGYIRDVWVYHRSCPGGVKSIERDWSFESRVKTAIRYLTKGLYEKALIALAEVREEGPLVFLLPNHPHLLAHIYNLRGMCYLQKGWFEAAIDLFKKAIGLRRGFVLAHYNLGFALAKGGKLESAVEIINKASGIEPEYDPDLREVIRRIEEGDRFQ